MPTLGERVRHRRIDVFEAAVRDAVMEGPSGDAVLAAALDDLPRSRHLEVVVALGDAQGTHGPRALRAVLASPAADRDMRCAAVLALAKRCGHEASADLAAALSSRDAAVKQYAMLGLAYAADDRAFDAAFTRLRHLVRRQEAGPPTDLAFLSVQPPAVAAIFYLARHLDGAGGKRTVRLVSELRTQWDLLPARGRRWLAETWPECGPDGPAVPEVPAPEPRRLDAWIARDPLFGPAH
ncbi:hypothetical protein [Yinghuangia soli]|uniref:hypothetical protein n=1 Tax=Yinghuangia soli TaxID=2908204 RepID=UPI001F3609AB|nr:hypothetical protein [Yinghuangia soli]